MRAIQLLSWRCIVFTSYLLSQVDYSTSAILARRSASVVVRNHPPLTTAPISFSAGQSAIVRSTSIFTTIIFTTVDVVHTITVVPAPTQITLNIPPLKGVPVAPSTFAVNAGQASVTLSSSTSIFTTTTAVPTVISGVSTTVNVVSTGTSVTLVPVSMVPVSTNASTLDISSKPSVLAYGPVVVLAVILAVAVTCIAIVLVKRLRARRLALPKDTGSNDRSNSIVPFKWPFVKSLKYTGATSRTKPIPKRQLYISNELQRARREVAELERLRMSIQSSRSSRRPPSSSKEDIVPDLPVLPSNEEDPGNDAMESARVEDRLESAMRQIEALNSRINELELQRRSSWALEEPPPGYDSEV